MTGYFIINATFSIYYKHGRLAAKIGKKEKKSFKGFSTDFQFCRATSVALTLFACRSEPACQVFETPVQVQMPIHFFSF